MDSGSCHSLLPGTAHGSDVQSCYSPLYTAGNDPENTNTKCEENNTTFCRKSDKLTGKLLILEKNP